MNAITRTIVYNIHPQSLIISTGAVMGGLTASVIRGGISVFPAIMTLLFAMLLQISANLYHGYFDLCFGAGENISGMGDRDSRSANSSRVFILRVVANGFGILALTAGMSLFSFIGWFGLVYVALIAIMLYLYFAGPKPMVRTKWSLLFTFLFFGPIAVSGTALIQNTSSQDLLPIAVYSVINGLLAANAHIAIQYIRYEEDKKNGKETLVTAKGGKFTRFVYLGNSLLVCAILIVRPSAVDFVSRWVGIAVAACVLLSSVWVFAIMHRNTVKVSRKVRTVTMYQYILVTLVLMAIVMCSVDKFNINIFHFL
ncbi:MAG: prenyltransferase [Muribaculaceae bacterium]|nr:prenyltransferase [Muribaculaceae bacterium]